MPKALTVEHREDFLKTLAATGNVSLAAQAAGMSRQSLYRLRRLDRAFAEAWADALDEAVDALEAEARRRAVEGTMRPVFYRGQVVGEMRHYSDAMLMFMLRAHRPEIYGGRATAAADEEVILEVYNSDDEDDATVPPGRALS